MARVVCPECGLGYDDVYRWTLCPHEAFEMRTVATRVGARGQTETRVCTSVEELADFMAGCPVVGCEGMPTDDAATVARDGVEATVAYWRPLVCGCASGFVARHRHHQASCRMPL
jgi:hypothetical protein